MTQPQDLINQVLSVITHSPDDTGRIINQLKSVVYEAEKEFAEANTSASLNDLIADHLGRISSGEPETGLIKTGFGDFDYKFNGFRASELIVIGGRPGMGKTQLLVTLANNISKNYPVLFFTYDLPDKLLASRFIANITGISLDKQLLSRFSESERTALMTIEEDLYQRQIFVNESFHDSISAFRSYCEYQVNERGIKVIMVDYLQMMSNPERGADRVQQLSAITRGLKHIARDLEVCVIVSSQLSRAPEARGGEMRPMLRDLRECGTIEQDADKVVFIYRPEYYGFTMDEKGDSYKGYAELEIAKNRNGRLGRVTLSVDDDFTAFSDFGGNRPDTMRFSSDWL